jgi:colicin import membrane protein
MNRIEHNADARHQSEALKALQKKAAEQKTVGGTTAAGKDQGVDYGAYIQSRLKDALTDTMVYRSKAPEAAVHIYLDKNGKIARIVMIRPSGDKLFNDSVLRAIEKAKVNFPPTPNGAAYDKLFLFSPQEVTK